MIPVRGALFAMSGALIGLLLGIVFDGVIWLWAFASVLDGAEAVSVGPVMEVTGADDSVTAVGGVGLLLLPAALAAAGAVGAALLARLRVRQSAVVHG